MNWLWGNSWNLIKALMKGNHIKLGNRVMVSTHNFVAHPVEDINIIYIKSNEDIGII